MLKPEKECISFAFWKWIKMLSKLRPIKKTFHRLRKPHEVQPKRGDGNAAMKQWHADTVFFNSLFLLFYFMLEMFLTFQDMLQLLSIFGEWGANWTPQSPLFFPVFPPLISNPSCFVSTKAGSFHVREQERGSHTTLNLSSVLFESSAYSGYYAAICFS